MSNENLIADLNSLVTQWERNCSSPDFADKGEWLRGVIYGIKLAIRIVHNRAGAQPALR